MEQWKTYTVLAGLVIVTLAVSACAPLPAPVAQESAPQSGGETEPLSLEGMEWELVAFGDEHTVNYQGGITALFADGQLSGSTGCNRYFAEYTLSGNSLKIGPVGMTMRACDDGLMAQEQAYASALESASTYQIDGNMLEIVYAAGVLTFQAARVTTPMPRSLEDTNWALTTFVTGDTAQSLLASSEITARFAEGKVSGSAGCNSYFAEYKTSGESIKIGPMGMTKMMCQEGVMKQEITFANAMQSATSYQIDGDTLRINHDGGQLVFRAQ